MPGYAKLILSLVGAVITMLIALVVSYGMNSDSPKTYVMTLIGVVAASSIIVGMLIRCIEYLTKDSDDPCTIGQAFMKSLYMPVMVGVIMFVFAGIPVLVNIIPPRYQTYPGEGMNILGAFRGIPESMYPVIGKEALPVAEMFYAFWGGLYGLTLA